MDDEQAVRYFDEFSDALDAADGEAAGSPRPADPGGDCLPFGHLEHRRFEVLAYRLQVVLHAPSGARVTLMQGVGERGRDVLVHDSGGSLSCIVQCKRYGDRLSEPEVRREIAKLALHHHLDASVLPENVRYEIWCPGDFTEPAASLIDTWPRGWIAPALRNAVEAVIEDYAAFRSLNWDSVRVSVETFADRLRVEKRTGIDITALARKNREIYECFFEGRIVMDRSDVAAYLDAKFAAGGLRQLTDEDAKHVLDRIESFAADARLVMPSGFVLGVMPDLVSRLRGAEFEDFVRASTRSTSDLAKTIMTACARLAHETARALPEEVRNQGGNLTMIFVQVLVKSMVSRVSSVSLLGSRFNPALTSYERTALRDRLEQQTEEQWESLQRCRDNYDRTKHPAGSDEEFRFRIAKHALQGIASREAFRERLRGAIQRHLDVLQKHYDQFIRLVPNDVLVIADTRTVFDDERLMKRMVESVKELETLRGSSQIPEVAARKR